LNRVGFFFGETKALYAVNSCRNPWRDRHGRSAVHRVARGPSLVQGVLPWRQRASAGKAFKDAGSWRLPNRLPDDVATRVVEAAAPGDCPEAGVLGARSSVAGEIEAEFARAGHIVVSNSRNYRMFDTVPLMIPEVNAEHLKLLDARARRRAGGPDRDQPELRDDRPGDGARAAAAVRLESTIVTTLQAISGGLSGVASWDILGNIIPHIGGAKREGRDRNAEDSRLARRAARCRPPGAPECHDTRVPVRDGHTGSNLGRPRAEADAAQRHRCVAQFPRPSAGTRVCRLRRSSRSCTSMRRTGRSRCWTSTATAA
jgi:aspartate-semialdehyde dehydrogenase